MKATADRALISLKVVTENKSLQEALRVNQELRGKILNALKERGLSAERVHASKFSSTPKYGMFSEKAKSYRVENVVKITAQDEQEFQAVAHLVDTMPEVRYDGIEFEQSDREALKAKAVAQAIDRANERKRLYEEKLGLKLVPKQIVENGVVPEPAAQLRRVGDQIGSRRVMALTSLPAASAVETQEMPTEFGELVYKAQVTVAYEVQNN